MENKKKGWIKWLIIGIAALLVAGGVLLAVMLLGQNDEGNAVGCDGRIYINVDRASYFGTDMPRYANDDGTYTVQFAVDGEQVRLTVKDITTVNHIDSREIMGLSFDEDGVVTGVVDIEEFTGGYAVKNMYAEAVNGNEILCNGASDYNGFQKTIILNENTKVYQGCGAGILTGTPATVAYDDELTAVMDEKGNITHVFIIPYQEPGDIYWNHTRMYDSTAGMTTREPDITGVYTYEMSVNGEQVTVKTRDMAIATALDKEAAKSYGLRFDEDGYVSEVIVAKTEVHGSYFASWHHVTEVNGNAVTTLKVASGNDQGQSHKGVLSRNCKIFDVSGVSGPIGTQVDSVQPGDQIHGLKDCRGQVCYVFIINRRVTDSAMYWNVNRNYNSTTKETGRTPDADGWYHILLAANGEQVTLKTKDKALVTAMDARADKHFGLKLDGDVITAVYTPSQITGGTFFASWYDVIEFSDTSVTARRNISGSSYGKVATAPIAENCKIYNVSSVYDSHVGEETTLRLGDRIHGETNVDGELEYIYVVNRLVDSPLYWNVNRMWDSKNSVSTRKPNADGVYEILLAYGGKQEMFYTTDPAVVRSIDAKADRYFGLEVHSGNMITKYYHPDSVTGGTYFASWCDVTKVGDDGITALRTLKGSNFGTYYTAQTSPEGCQIYNVSSGYTYFCGEPTHVKIGDRIQGQTDYNGYLVYIYIVENRTTEYPTAQHECTHVQEDVDWKVWTGVSGISESGHYVLEDDLVLTANRTIADNIDVTLCLNGHTISGDVSLLTVRYGATLTICDHKNGDGTWAGTMSSGFTGTSGGVLYAYDGATVNVYGGNFYHTATCKMAGLMGIGNKGAGATLNIYDGLFSGGTTTGDGGNFYIYEGATMNVYGGTIQNGTSAGNGGNIRAHSKTAVNVYGGTIQNGTAKTGGNIYIGTVAQKAEVTDYASLSITGGTVQNGSATGSRGGNIAVINAAKGTISGGQILGGTTTNDGGSIIVSRFDADTHSDTTLTVTGGTISGGTAPANGGNFWLYKGTLELQGGTVTGGTAKLGGGIYVLTDGKLHMDDVTITGNTVKNGVGGDVYAVTKSTVTLNGKVNISNMFLNNGIMELGADGLDDSSKIGVHKVVTGPILNTADEKDAACFESINEDYTVAYENAQVVLQDQNPPHSHCICNGDSVGLGGHESCTTATWTAWESATSLPTDSGYYYLTCDVDLSSGSHVNLARGVQQHICLNGFDIKGPKSDTMWWVREYLSISDCKGDGQVISQSTVSGTMLHVFCNHKDDGPAGTFELYGGTLTAAKKSSQSTGILMIGNSGTKACYFNMYGGKITGGQATKEGGAIFLNTTGAVMNMYGGEISGNKADTMGGGVYVSKGVFNMHGGTIENNTAGTYGGGVYASSGTFNLYGGTIKDNTATTNGGNLYVNTNGKAFIYGGTIEGGSAAHGGSINTQGTITMSGGTVTGGWTTGSSGEGGNIRIGGSGVFTLKGGIIENGGVKDGATVTNKGGNVLTFGTLIIEGGKITGGKCKLNGGNIAMWGGKLTMTDGTVENGYAPNNGGNICVDNSATISVTGGTVTGGTAGGNGGGIYVSANSTATVTGTVTGNKKSDGTDSDIYEA